MQLFTQIHVKWIEAPEMEIIIKFFLLIYFLAMVVLTILGVFCVLTAIFKPEWATKKELVKAVTNISTRFGFD